MWVFGGMLQAPDDHHALMQYSGPSGIPFGALQTDENPTFWVSILLYCLSFFLSSVVYQICSLNEYANPKPRLKSAGICSS